MSVGPSFISSSPIKLMINIGALMDIPTGSYVSGKYGESILNGGLGFATGVVGIGNNFKSTIAHYMTLSAMSRINSTCPSNLNTYDTEVNTHESQLAKLANRFPEFGGANIIESGLWTITDKTVYYANEWYEILKKFLRDKKASVDKNGVETPFVGRDKITPLKIAVPTFTEVDSFTAFETEDVAKIQDNNELGDSGGNTIHMRQGLAKMRFLMELPALNGGASNYTILTAHVGKEIQMASGPMPAPPTKKLQYLKNGDKLKGVTDQFFFLMNNCWHAYNAAPYMNQGTKTPEYPRDSTDNVPGDTDLNIVTLRQLRSKSGPTGYALEILVSQSDGVLAELTEFHSIKQNDRYGLSGTLQHYSLDLYPDVKIQRTTVRSRIDSDSRLRRAINITSEMLQMKQYWHNVDEYLCTPKELYEDLKKMGYDWDVLLDTRGWWTIKNEMHPIPFLSTMDLLKMRKGEYTPYWMDKDKKKI